MLYQIVRTFNPIFHQTWRVMTAVFAAFLVALLIDMPFPKVECMLSALLICQTTRGTPLRQGLIIFLIIVMATLIAMLFKTFSDFKIKYMMILLLFVAVNISSYSIYRHRLRIHSPVFLFLYFNIMLLLLLVTTNYAVYTITQQLTAISIGASIGIACNLFIFPTSIVHLFQRSIYTVLQALAAYDEALQNSLLKVVQVDADKTEALLLLAQRKIQIQQLMQTTYGDYPEWVYELGLNPGLRGGFRFFLIHIERMIELYFAMEYLVHRLNKQALPQELLQAVIKVMHFNHELMLILMHYFKHHQWQDTTSSDLMSDMFDLQTALANAVPAHLGLLDISPDYVMLTDLVRNIKDIRELLLQLIESLPKAN